MIKAIIFDLDGLLVDSEMNSFYVLRDFLAPYNIPLSKKGFTETYSGRSEKTNIHFMIDTYHLPISYDDARDQIASLEDSYIDAGIPLKTGAVQLLDFLKENAYRIALATSSKEERALRMLEQHHIVSYFDVCVFADEVQHGKPAPDIFLTASKKLQTLPHECLVLEDSEAGILAAHNAEIPVINIPDMRAPSSTYTAMCAAQYPSLYDVITYLEQNH